MFSAKQAFVGREERSSHISCMGSLILRSSRSFVAPCMGRPFLHTKKQTLPMLTPSMFKASFPERNPVQNVACEQALRGALAMGREKEREPATTAGI